MKKLCSMLLALCMLAGFAVVSMVPAGASANPYEPPADLGELSQAEQLAYFNLVVNRVREEKPGFQRRDRTLIDTANISSDSSLISVIAPGIILLAERLWSGWSYQDIGTGQDNRGLFLSGNANASDLRPEDIVSAEAAYEDGYWVLEVRVRASENPQPGTGSSIGRIADILTGEALMNGMAEVGVTADPADVDVRYQNGYARVTVNREGYVVAAENGYYMHTQFDDIRLSSLNMSLSIPIPMTCEWQYARFDWTDDIFLFPDPPVPEPPPAPWWQSLPSWLQWVLRWFFFGWIWMEG